MLPILYKSVAFDFQFAIHYHRRVLPFFFIAAIMAYNYKPQQSSRKQSFLHRIY